MGGRRGGLGVLLGAVAALATYLFALSTRNPRPVDTPTPAGARVLKWFASRGGANAAAAWVNLAAIYHHLTSVRVRRGLADFPASPRRG